jgi:signal transduction histidine kinase
MASVVDVTERKAAESARDEAEHALRQSQKLETIGQLTGGVAHDFNNLLMAVRSSLELLRKRLPAGDERAHSYLANALAGAERGATLTQRMLAFARRQELDPRPVDVAALLPGMRDSARTLARAGDGYRARFGRDRCRRRWSTRTSSRWRCSTSR